MGGCSVSRWAGAGRPLSLGCLVTSSTPPLPLSLSLSPSPLPSPLSVCHNSFSSLLLCAALLRHSLVSFSGSPRSRTQAHLLRFPDGVEGAYQQRASNDRQASPCTCVCEHVPPGPRSTASGGSLTSGMRVCRRRGAPEDRGQSELMRNAL